MRGRQRRAVISTWLNGTAATEIATVPTVQRRPEIVTTALDRLTRMSPHPNPNSDAPGPRLVEQRMLRMQSRINRQNRARERGREGLARRREHVALIEADRLP